MRQSPSLLARSLEPLTSALWIFFLVWTALVAVLWVGGTEIVAGISNAGLRSAVNLIVHASDTIWLILAAANLYLHLAESEGLARARFIALVIAATAFAVAACSAWTGYPAGSIAFTTRLGMKLGPVPFGWPVLWFVVVVSGRGLGARLLPRASHWALAATAGCVALLTDLNLEPVATKIRLFWFWYVSGSHLPSPPLWRNYACWFIVATALAGLIREQKLASSVSRSWRPAVIIILVNALLILGHVRAAIGG